MLINFKSAMAARGHKQVDFAVNLRISPVFLSQIIHERVKPDAALRSRLARALDADEEWLFSNVVRIPAP